MKPLLIIFLLSISCLLYSQARLEVGHLNEDGSIRVETKSIEKNDLHMEREGIEQLDNFPFGSTAHPNFKNNRNVSIADLDGDGTLEIVVCMNQTVFAIKSTGDTLWTTAVSGTSNYPPAISDIDNDGDLEIALQTYGVPVTGNVYLLDHEGVIQEGWPLNIDNHFFINAITLVDMDDDGVQEIIASERISSSEGRIHILNHSGGSYSDNWPVSVPGTPALTPSVADVDGDGKMELLSATTTALYLFEDNGTVVDGFPVAEEGTKFSYQGPLLVDLDGDNSLEIVCSRHGDNPGPFIVNAQGEYLDNWPQYDSLWTYAPPSIADIDGDGEMEIFFGRPYTSDDTESSILLGYEKDGSSLDGFPVQGNYGTEGIITIADIDNDGDYEILTPSKTAIDGLGFINAYHIETQEMVEGFPLRVNGLTFLNGAYLSDVNNNGLLDVTCLSFQNKFNPSSPDSAFINVFELEYDYIAENILFNGYKGSDTHQGVVLPYIINSIDEVSRGLEDLLIYPNPTLEFLTISDLEEGRSYDYLISDINGKRVMSGVYEEYIDIRSLLSGAYVLSIIEGTNRKSYKFVKQ